MRRGAATPVPLTTDTLVAGAEADEGDVGDDGCMAITYRHGFVLLIITESVAFCELSESGWVRFSSPPCQQPEGVWSYRGSAGRRVLSHVCPNLPEIRVQLFFLTARRDHFPRSTVLGRGTAQDIRT